MIQMTTWQPTASGSGTVVTTYTDGVTSSSDYRHRCVINPTRARANQHQRTEYGRCDCGQRFARVIRWGERRASRWQRVRP